MLSCDGFICLKCYDALYHKGLEVVPPDSTPIDFTQRSAICRCGNLAVIWDEDLTPRLYVDVITSAQRAHIFCTDDYKEVNRHLLKSFGYALFEPLDFKDTPLKYTNTRPRNPYQRKTSTKYDDKLIHALTRHKNVTSDGKEDFQRTTSNNPLSKE